MTIQFLLYFVLLFGMAIPLGNYMARVYSDTPFFAGRALGPIERALYKLCRIRRDEEMNWRTYAGAMLVFNLIGILVVYLIQRLQPFLPLNPEILPAINPDSSFNTAVSFASNTNWQGYGGETTMSYFTQMLVLTVQNFVSAAAGIAVLFALIRGFTRANISTIGNFWCDLVRATLYVLLPLSLLLALLLVSQGVAQTYSPYVRARLLDSPGVDPSEQVIALGPAASQIAIKQLGTNGGGFFNVNSAHPFENPTPLTNLIELIAILLISAGLCHSFGVLVGDRRQGWCLLATMTLIYVACLIPCAWLEGRGNPRFDPLGVDRTASAIQPGGNMEGKEVRFGIAPSVLWATATTAASNGSINSMHDSYMPLSGLFPMLLMQLGEVVYGGVGSGLYGMIAFALVAVFIAGLMVGRTPEYLGKKIGAYEMKLVSIIILLPCLLVLIGTAFAVIFPAGGASITNPGAHGFSQALYAYSSMGNNNGSAFAGFGANIPLHNFCGGVVMFLARYWLAIPTLALAGSLARKTRVPSGPGTLETHTPLFVCLLMGVVLLIGALNFIPALALGPIIEQLEL